MTCVVLVVLMVATFPRRLDPRSVRLRRWFQRHLGFSDERVPVSLSRTPGCRPGERGRARLQQEATVEEFYARVCAALEGLPFELCWWTTAPATTRRMLRRLAESDPRVRVVYLSRNFGHQTALTAGWTTPVATPW